MKFKYQVPKIKIQQVRESTDIVGLIAEHVLLKKTGTNFKGLCPFHKEKTPSFVVSPQKQIYHCFGCGEGGNAFDFLIKIKNIGFKEALSSLAGRAGIQISLERETASDSGGLFKINGVAADFYMNQLLDKNIGGPARDYLKSRGLNRSIAEKFKLGYAKDGWSSLTDHIKSEPNDLKNALKAGLIIEKKRKGEYYDRFRSRLMFPIIDLDSRVIGFGGRTLIGEDAKYLNSPESEVFPKRNSFYGLDKDTSKAIREEESAILVEGYMDLIALRKNGFMNSLAALGTAFTFDHAKKLKRFTDNVYFTFDSDNAGINAVRRVLKPVLSNSLNAKVIALPEPFDPDSYLNEKGKDRFKELIGSAEGILEFFVKRFYETQENAVARAKILDEMKDCVLCVDNSFERELVASKIAQLTGMRKEMFVGTDQGIRGESVKQYKSHYPKEELYLIKFILEDASFMKKAKATDIFDYFSSEELKQLAIKIGDVSTGNALNVSDVIDDIEDSELKKSLVHTLLRETGFNPDNIDKAFMDCAQAIKKNYKKIMKTALNAKLKEAERLNDEEKRKQLLMELNTLNKG